MNTQRGRGRLRVRQDAQERVPHDGGVIVHRSLDPAEERQTILTQAVPAVQVENADAAQRDARAAHHPGLQSEVFPVPSSGPCSCMNLDESMSPLFLHQEVKRHGDLSPARPHRGAGPRKAGCCGLQDLSSLAGGGRVTAPAGSLPVLQPEPASTPTPDVEAGLGQRAVHPDAVF